MAQREPQSAGITPDDGPEHGETFPHGAILYYEATDVPAEVIAQRFARGAVDGKIQAHVVTIEN